MHVARSQRLPLALENTDDYLEHPVVPAVPGRGWRNRLLGSAVVRAIFGTGKLHSIIRAAF